jgi:hypothetical protein
MYDMKTAKVERKVKEYGISSPISVRGRPSVSAILFRWDLSLLCPVLMR